MSCFCVSLLQVVLAGKKVQTWISPSYLRGLNLNPVSGGQCHLTILKQINIFTLMACFSVSLLQVVLAGKKVQTWISASDLQGLNFESCVWRAVSSHHPQEVLLAQFSLYVHKSGLIYKARFISNMNIYKISVYVNFSIIISQWHYGE